MQETPLIVALLLIAGAWFWYLYPNLVGSRRDAPLNSTEEFDRWTHLMADVQRRAPAARVTSRRDVVKSRRRRSLVMLALGAIGAAVAALATEWNDNLLWLVHAAFDALIILFLGILAMIRQQQRARFARRYGETALQQSERAQVRIIAQ